MFGDMFGLGDDDIEINPDDCSDLDDLIQDLDDGITNDPEVGLHHHDGFSAKDAFLLGALTTPLVSASQALLDAGRRYVQEDPPEEPPPPPPPRLPRTPAPTPRVDDDDSLLNDVLLWEDFIGQEQAKRQLDVHISASASQRRPLGHVLLSGPAGNGKTTLASLIHLRYCELIEEGADFIRLTAPVDRKVLTDILLRLSSDPPSFVFIDEIHKMADGGARNAEFLLHILEDGKVPVNGTMSAIRPFTMIGGTTDPAKLPETIVDRFPIRPYLRPYTEKEMVRIAHKMCNEHQVEADVPLLVCMAKASLRNPRCVRDMVMAARDMQQVNDRAPKPAELLSLLDLATDGLTWQHRKYLKVLLATNGYLAGESHMASMLHEDPRTLRRLERPLLDLGFVERTPSGRLLTAAGVERARRAS